MRTIAIRIRAQSQQEAEQAKQQLEQQHGRYIRLGAARVGRSRTVWFVYGTLQLASDSPSDLIEHFLPTDTIPISRLEDIPNDEQVAAALDSIHTIRPELAMQAKQRWDALDHAFDQEGGDRLAIAIIRLAQQLHTTRKEAL